MRAGRVFRRGSSWSYVVDLAPVGAPRRQKTKAGFRTKADALQAMQALQSSIAAGTYVEPVRLTLSEYLEQQWLPAVEGTGVRATTLRSYRMHADQHIGPTIGDLQLQAVTGADLNRLYGVLLASGRANGKGGLSPATVRRVHAVLRKALGDAVRWGRLARNPADAADPPRPSDTAAVEMATWSPAELSAFLDHVRTDRLYPLWLTLAATGLRRGEAVGLRWVDVDLEAGRLAVRQTLVAVGYEVQVADPKTRRGRRSVALDRDTVAELRSWRVRQSEERLAWGPAWVDDGLSSGLVFTRENGEHLHPDRVSKLFDGAVTAAKLPRIRLHDLRHTHATLALAAGVHPKVVSERLGHSTVSLTLDVYSHAIPAMQEDAAELVAGLVRSAVSIS